MNSFSCDQFMGTIMEMTSSRDNIDLEIYYTGVMLGN
jgi:hypothetical protein